jgi:hypothetical protein
LYDYCKSLLKHHKKEAVRETWQLDRANNSGIGFFDVRELDETDGLEGNEVRVELRIERVGEIDQPCKNLEGVSGSAKAQVDISKIEGGIWIQTVKLN